MKGFLIAEKRQGKPCRYYHTFMPIEDLIGCYDIKNGAEIRYNQNKDLCITCNGNTTTKLVIRKCKANAEDWEITPTESEIAIMFSYLNKYSEKIAIRI